MTERKLATIRRISDIQPIPDADAIEVVTVDGWKVVAQKAMNYKIGELVVYFEIDSWIPHSLAPFLSKNAGVPKVYNGVEGERLKTIRLRGQISQGLLMPLETVSTEGGPLNEGEDLTDMLGIQKWEPPIPTNLAGQVRGTFPTQYCDKTDQQRIQNVWKEVYSRRAGQFECTMKLDGSSMTLLKIGGELRIASRNQELKINHENAGNSFIRAGLKIAEKIVDVEDIAIQFELMGPGVQGNRENLKEMTAFVFEITDIKTRKKWDAISRIAFCRDHGLEHVPVLSISELPFETMEEALAFANGPSLYATRREGVVFKSLSDPEFSFKIISNEWLLKNES